MDASMIHSIDPSMDLMARHSERESQTDEMNGLEGAGKRALTFCSIFWLSAVLNDY